MQQKKAVFLLRAFGDFAIAVYTASLNRLDTPVTLIASAHLEHLYGAIPVALPPNVTILFQDFKIRNNILSCFTDRHLFSIDTISELMALRSYAKKLPGTGTDYYLENQKRILLPSFFAGNNFKYIVSHQNVYRAYADFFSVPFNEMEDAASFPKQKALRVLVIPDARQEKRSIANEVINKIVETYEPSGGTVVSAFLKRQRAGFSTRFEIYESFDELVQLIVGSDLIIGADSMPVHLAQLLGKPHYILHPSNVKEQFFTPFALKHKTCFTFEEIASRKSFLPDA